MWFPILLVLGFQSSGLQAKPPPPGPPDGAGPPDP